MAKAGDAPSFRLRTESWTIADGRTVHLLVAGSPHRALAHAFMPDAAGRAILHSEAWIPPALVEADRDRLLAALGPFGPVREVTLEYLGLLDDGSGTALSAIANVARHLVALKPPSRPLPASTLRAPCAPGSGFDQRPVPSDDHLVGMTFREVTNTDLPRARPPATVHDIPVPLPPGEPWDLISPWYASLRSVVRPPGLPPLGPGTWSVQAFRHYTEPGEAGRRRIQAAAVYPAFVSTLAFDSELVRLVDDGKPFEERLLAVLQEYRRRQSWPRGDGPRAGWRRGSLTLAKLRRMRTLAHFPGTQKGEAISLLDTCAEIPLDWMPADAAAWANLSRMGIQLNRMTDAEFHLGLDPADIVRDIPRDWNLVGLIPGAPVGETPVADVVNQCSDARDMATRFQDSVLMPIWARDPDRMPRPALTDAARILYGGKGLGAAWALQRRWHADPGAPGQDPLEGERSWPALFAPFTHAGVTIRCLTGTSALAAEGGRGDDDDGMAGLGHCVRGYAARCYEGTSHVASVTAPDADGIVRRLSTLELNPAEDGPPAVSQHRGARNGNPPAEAIAAVAALMAALADGSVTVDPAALATRRVPRLQPSAIDPVAALEAWRPYLGRATLSGGIPGLMAAVRGREEEGPANHAA